MSGSCVIPLPCDYNVKEVKLTTFKLKHDDNTEKETFNDKKFDGTTIDSLFNTMLSFQTMYSRMEFTDPMMFSYFDKCFLDHALEEWCSVTTHEDYQRVKNFKFSLEEWFNALLPNKAFLAQKEWMTNTMKKPYIMKVKDFGNRLKTLNCYQTHLPRIGEKHAAFTDTDLMALLF
jgi:hypothetical protein